jgi:glycosyltransferase involved in cell wall biosynthesis
VVRGSGILVRVVYVWDAEYPWDVRTEKICRSLRERKVDVHLLARNRRWDVVREPLPEGTVHRIRPWRVLGRRADALLTFPAFFNPRWVQHIGAVVRRERPHVILVRDLPLCPTAILIGRLHGVPVVLDMAEDYPAMLADVWRAGRQRPADFLVRNPRLAKLVERLSVPAADRVLVVVEESGTRLEALGVPRDRISVVSNTPPLSRVGSARSGSARPGDTLQVVYLGLMEVPRGIADLIEAVSTLRRRGVPVRLRLIGDGRDLAIFRGLSARLGLTSADVEFTGRLENARALELLNEASVGVVPHHATPAWNTTIPNKLFDYMAAGMPVVTSDAAPAARIVRETGAGLVFRSEDAESLADTLARMLDPALRDRCGAAGRVAVERRYNWEADVNVLMGVLESLTR